MNAEEIEKLAGLAEALLFTEGGPITIKKLAQLLYCKDDSEAIAALKLLSEKLKGRGISLMLTDTEAALAVSAEAAPLVQKASDLELSREIGDAGLEVLAILLYRGRSTRAEIDYIRGVNSSTTLRTLLARGLVSRAGNPQDARGGYVYGATAELLAHLGAADSSKLPDYARITGELASFEAKKDITETTDANSAATTRDAPAA